jgi:hypothetical protein
MSRNSHKSAAVLALAAILIAPLAAAQADDVGVLQADSMWQSFSRSVSRSVSQNSLVRSVGEWFGRGDNPEAASPSVTVQPSELQLSRNYERSLERSLDRSQDRSGSEIILSPDLMLEAFPALGAMDDTLRLMGVSHQHTVVGGGSGVSPGPSGLDMSASYVWESARFGQFILSTNTTYVYNPLLGDAAVEAAATALPLSDASNFGAMPELQSSLTFTWQIGNHSASAVTSYSETMENFANLSVDRLNIDQLNELVGQMATLDLRYGYNVRAGRQGQASFSLGVRNFFDRRQFTPIADLSGRQFEPGGRVAYGTIKYQF